MAGVAGDDAGPPPVSRQESENADLENYATGDGIKVTEVESIMEKDKEDESLQRYKMALLGGADAAGASEDADKRAVIFDSMILHHPNEPGGRNIVIPLSTEADVEAAKKMNPVVKEGAAYTYEVRFRIHRGIVSGLQLSNKVYGSLGVELDRDEVVLGSFAPKVAKTAGKDAKAPSGDGAAKEPEGAAGGSAEAAPAPAPTTVGGGKMLPGLPAPREDQYVFRDGSIDEYPTGMMARGQYRARCKVKDDDGNVHLRFEYSFTIASEWPKEEEGKGKGGGGAAGGGSGSGGGT